MYIKKSVTTAQGATAEAWIIQGIEKLNIASNFANIVLSLFLNKEAFDNGAKPFQTIIVPIGNRKAAVAARGVNRDLTPTDANVSQLLSSANTIDGLYSEVLKDESFVGATIEE